jgi:hypothetical protein
MRSTHFIRLALIVIWQAVMVACLLYFDSSSSHRWVLSVIAISALLLPFVGYIAAVYHAPLFARWSRLFCWHWWLILNIRRWRALKMLVLTSASVVVTIVGYVAFFILGLWLKGEKI